MLQAIQKNYSIRIEDMTINLLLTEACPSEDEAYLSESKGLLKTIDTTTHTHSYAELFICTEGSITIKVNNGNIIICPGDILIIPSGIEHVKFPAEHYSVWKSVGFSITKRQVQGSERYYQRFQSLVYSESPLLVNNSPLITQRIAAMTEKLSSSKIDFTALEFANILADIVNGVSYKSASNQKVSDLSSVDINFMARLERIIALNSINDIDVKEVADKLFISTHQLNRICHKRYGVTFRQALINRRLKLATSLLTTTKTSIEEIGNSIGFNSRTSFFRAFTAKYGVSPNEYRKRYS